ncbi:hypothetical protein [Nitrolancea hollandica]|uniref:Uncharacterized protein n=1 Tax=Nitrolancea hollandica Lb TaxID=1129897 RepID=I4EK40_9BACT|nr:hypothetical protein [Nitrolancea hollandica]CCF85052.1 hypothetical protein NITHO_440002 [Nitrolancea hollandica Lb]
MTTDMNAVIRRAAGRTVATTLNVHEQKKATANQAVNDAIRRAAGRLPESKEDTDDRND